MLQGNTHQKFLTLQKLIRFQFSLTCTLTLLTHLVGFLVSPRRKVVDIVPKKGRNKGTLCLKDAPVSRKLVLQIIYVGEGARSPDTGHPTLLRGFLSRLEAVAVCGALKVNKR